MDIDYLLLLQDLRNALPDWVSDFASIITKFAVSWLALCIPCIVYWVLDRKAGKRILAGFGLGMLMNGLLKLCFCVYRPWIRDARVEPWGDSKTAATGYSFPSGHSTFATSLIGGTGFWARKKNIVVTVVMYILVALILFSRNFLGVHTPQDVIVGLLATIVMMIAAYKIEDWTDKDPDKRDIIVMVAGIVIVIALALFYNLKSYPMTYLEDGSLLVDPKKMTADSYEGIGFVAVYVICRYFERRRFRFDELLTKKQRAIIAVPACVPIALWKTYAVDIIKELANRDIAKLLLFSTFIFYVLIVVPFIMELIGKRLSAKNGEKQETTAE